MYIWVLCEPLHNLLKPNYNKYMSTKKCKVDIVSVQVRQLEKEGTKMTFVDILKHPEIINQEKHIANRIVHYSIIDENEKYIIGFLRSTLDKDLPAKIDKKTKEISKLDVKESEGLAYGSIFLYSKDLSTIFFEINKNCIYLDSFRKFIIKCYLDSKDLKAQTGFDIIFGTIYRKHEYERALGMTKFKEFKMKVHQPGALLEEIKKVNRSLEEKVKLDFSSELENAAELNSDIAEIHYKVSAKREKGLYKDKILPMIQKFHKLLGFSEIRELIDVVEIVGYTVDNTKAKKPIDLLGDIYYGTFKISVPRLDSDLQKKERKDCIKDLYLQEYATLKSYL